MAYDNRPVSYPDLIYRHLDRMSDSLKKGIEYGGINTAFLTSYYLFIVHFKALLTTRVSGPYLRKINEYKLEMKPLGDTAANDLKKNVEYIESITKIFEVLLIVANETGLISTAPRHFDELEDLKEFEEDADNTKSNN